MIVRKCPINQVSFKSKSEAPFNRPFTSFSSKYQRQQAVPDEDRFLLCWPVSRWVPPVGDCTFCPLPSRVFLEQGELRHCHWEAWLTVGTDAEYEGSHPKGRKILSLPKPHLRGTYLTWVTCTEISTEHQAPGICFLFNASQDGVIPKTQKFWSSLM